MKYSIEWFYALVSGKLVKPENVYVKCPTAGSCAIRAATGSPAAGTR